MALRWFSAVFAMIVASLAVAPAASGGADSPPTCMGQPATIWGESDVSGTPAADVIVGTPRKDRLRGGAGLDTICGLDGDDRIVLGADGGSALGGPGDDILVGDNSFLSGDTGWDRCRGTSQRFSCEPRLRVAPNAPLARVPIGTRANDAIARIQNSLGAPTTDTGWAIGACSDRLERTLVWGDVFGKETLGVSLAEVNGRRILASWYYTGDGPGSPRRGDVRLPAGLRWGMPMTEAADVLGSDVIVSLDTGATVKVDGLMLGGSDGREPLTEDEPLTAAGIPFLPSC